MNSDFFSSVELSIIFFFFHKFVFFLFLILNNIKQNMFTKIKYFYLLTLITCLKLVAFCVCSNVHNSEFITESRKLSDTDNIDIEQPLINSENLINPPNSYVINEPLTNDDYQFYNPPESVPETETDVYDAHYVNAPIKNQTYYTQLSPVYKNNNPIVTNKHPMILRITTKQPLHNDLFSAFPPFLEKYYAESYRNIKSSVMNFMYKLQDFVSYLMHFFNNGEFNVVFFLNRISFICVAFWFSKIRCDVYNSSSFEITKVQHVLRFMDFHNFTVINS